MTIIRDLKYNTGAHGHFKGLTRQIAESQELKDCPDTWSSFTKRVICKHILNEVTAADRGMHFADIEPVFTKAGEAIRPLTEEEIKGNAMTKKVRELIDNMYDSLPKDFKEGIETNVTWDQYKILGDNVFEKINADEDFTILGTTLPEMGAHNNDCC